ncbi:MAG TPA: FRG domain-containing protein [Methylobacter sp.]|jgi:hypothetical protein
MIELGEANTLAELIEATHNAEKKFDGQLWFRGQAQSDWQLKPGAHRREPILESQFANHFRLRAPSLAANCPEHKDYISWLPLMQHYGLPTRLLDWTESLLVAAFFALLPKSTESSSAAIWLLAPGKLNEQQGGFFIPFLADYRVEPLVIDAFSGRPPNPENQYSIAVFAPRKDKRMVAQLGNYTLHGSRESLETHPESSQFLARILIPATSHNKIRADLSVSGMRFSSLFPDLASLAQEVSELTTFDVDGKDLESDSADG